MFRNSRKIITTVLLIAAGTVNAQTTLDQIIPTNRQKQLGLDRLSPQQRNDLAQLLHDIYQTGVQEGMKANISPSTSSVIETQIDGEFNGWEGETIVKLMNGQIWQQTEYHYHYHYAFMPKVLIYRNNGGYKMKVEGTDKAIGVEPLN